MNGTGGVLYSQDYADGLEYRTNGSGGSLTLEAIYHAEGRITPLSAGAYRYEYTLKDHLGNARLSFADLNGNKIVDVPEEIVQENHYYPFGLNANYSWMNNTTLLDNRYQYNGKELNYDFGLNWNDYGARWYDAAVGRWWSVDPLADQFPGRSPYNYTLNNPINMIDPDGRAPYWIPDGKGNLIAEAGDNAQTLAKHMGTTYSHALGVLNSNGYTTTRKGNHDVLNLNVGDKVNIALGSGYSWSSGESSGAPLLADGSGSSTASSGGVSTSTLLGATSDGVGGLGTGLTTQGGSLRLTNGAYNGNTLSPKYYESGWGGGSRAQIKTYNLKTLGKVGGRLGTAGTVVLGTVDVGTNAYYEGGFGVETQKATGRFAGSLGGGAAGAYIGAHFLE